MFLKLIIPRMDLLCTNKIFVETLQCDFCYIGIQFILKHNSIDYRIKLNL